MTVGDVIAKTADGADVEDIFRARRYELDMMNEMDLVFDTDPAQVNDKGLAQPSDPEETTDTPQENTQDEEAPPDDET